MIRTATYIAAAATLAIAIGGGIPRLIGTGCTDGAFGYTGPRLARTQADFIGKCTSITPIFID